MRVKKTKTVNPATKMSEIKNGHIQKRRVRCGKANCKCTKGFPHTAHYHVWRENGRRFQSYVRQSQLEVVKAACLTSLTMQRQLRAGRAEYKKILVRARELMRILSR